MTATTDRTPAWHRITPTGSKAPCPRSSHGVSLFAGKKLVVYGGEAVARTPIDSTVWIIDDIDDVAPTWRAVQTDVVPPRVAHAQAVVDSKLYVFGGRQGITMEEAPLCDIWAFDLEAETWKEVEAASGTPPAARSFHQMVAVGKTLYVFGGCSAQGRLSDLHAFDVPTRTWSHIAKPQGYAIAGRGGATVLAGAKGDALHVMAGFAGQEMNDQYQYRIGEGWASDLLTQKQPFRARSVCASGTMPLSGRMVLFGGEVDPSAYGHEGAGGFTNDIVILADDGQVVTTIPRQAGVDWPEGRGWTQAATRSTEGDTESLIVFGGLSGTDAAPLRLGDLWRLDMQPN